MASIVEKEARVAEERPVIAAVYYNRLRRGMRLQADPTVQFARGRHAERVLYKDLEIESPYNTYIHKGLPPGPIASPGVASLAAAAHPANVPYLYFVASRDGHHEFRMTLEEHTNAIRQVRAKTPQTTKPLMLASAPTNGSARRATKSTTKPAVKPAAKTATKTPARTTASKTPAKTASKVTSKAATKTPARTASKTAVKTAPKKTTKSADTTKKRLAAAQTTHR